MSEWPIMGFAPGRVLPRTSECIPDTAADSEMVFHGIFKFKRKRISQFGTHPGSGAVAPRLNEFALHI